jgi:tetratricopeptide (TPR) repeat protein
LIKPSLSRKELIERARRATQRRDWDAAFRLWDAVRALYPDGWWAYAHATSALRYAGRLAEAEALSQTAVLRFPDHPAIAIGHARIAAARRAWRDALCRWEAVRTRFPGRPEGETGAAAATRALSRLEEARARKELIEQAREATDRRDWPEAVRRWEAVRTRFPNRPDGYSRAAEAQRALGRLEEAEKVLVAAAVRFPEHQRIAVEYARSATARRNWPKAIRRWEAVRARWPDRTESYICTIEAMRALGHSQEAEKLLGVAVARFPERRSIAVNYAQSATERRDWPEALRRWDVVRIRFPDRPEGYSRAAEAQRTLGQAEVAERVLAAAATRFPEHRSIAIDYARSATDRGDWQEALRRWKTVRARWPDRPESYLRMVEAMRALGRWDAAEKVLAVAAARFPENRSIAIDYAKVATARRAWPQAAERWKKVAMRFLNRRDGGIVAAEAVRALGRPDDDEVAAKAGIECFADRHDWKTMRCPAENLIAGEASPAQAFLALARAQWHLKDFVEAERAAQRALAIEPVLVEAAIIGAWAAIEQADGTKALTYYRKLTVLEPNVSLWPLQLVRTLNLLGRTKEALGELENIVRRKPGDPLVTMYLLAGDFLTKPQRLPQHKHTRRREARRSDGKIFGIGLSRTGTTSLHWALGMLGFRSIHYPPADRLSDYLHNYDAATDTPVACNFRELDDACLGSRFILTVRDSNSWISSAERFFLERPEPRDRWERAVRIKTYGALQWDRDLFMHAYHRHIADVADYFRNRPNALLIMNIVAGEGWNVLCPFLGIAMQDVPFPHANHQDSNVSKPVIDTRA